MSGVSATTCRALPVVVLFELTSAVVDRDRTHNDGDALADVLRLLALGRRLLDEQRTEALGELLDEVDRRLAQLVPPSASGPWRRNAEAESGLSGRAFDSGSGLRRAPAVSAMGSVSARALGRASART